VIANNPHWVQNAEVYKGKLIVYSTGNFIFDQIDAETMRSASIDVSITTDYNQNVQAWLKLGQQCKTFQDNCLEQAEKTGLKKINLQLHYGVVAGQGGAHELTHKADAATQRAVEDRLNWVQALKELSQKQ
jgi:poly-gamma-glutamate capsule biosynthesis protein CapA/YwtB (metallophosphatase superfamily)